MVSSNHPPRTEDTFNPVTSVSRRSRHTKIRKRDWAHVIDVNKPMTNFHKLVPEMAHKANISTIRVANRFINMLIASVSFRTGHVPERGSIPSRMGDSVFVAAHTSAGKTVVAEYAIALAEKHMNGKPTSGDMRAVLPTDSLQCNLYLPDQSSFQSKIPRFQTDIFLIVCRNLDRRCSDQPRSHLFGNDNRDLRSMLYKGADLIRDVEFVVFDEVHYVNDAEVGLFVGASRHYHAEAGMSEVLCGRKLSSCFLIMST